MRPDVLNAQNADADYQDVFIDAVDSGTEYSDCETDTVSSDDTVSSGSSSGSSNSSSSAASDYVEPGKCRCECGRVVNRDDMARHYKTNIHRKFMYEKWLADNNKYAAVVYCICKVDEPEDGLLYIGSTSQPLYRRIAEHRKRYRQPFKSQYSSKKLFDEYGGPAACKIKLLEHVQVSNAEELRQAEQRYIEKYADRCVNIRRAIKETQ